ncbi:hypothetical protein E1B28_011785 [Marasmius oreades]|uniref:Uncharacterized protein n=1 Tax=Marasmius oreades TaxID=181124 RepID=A0A9P7RW87_9AGAR|nr:uncharacterized protein E1B28_011785 [Marasmius oreades]KAG7090178.1 hypothetical protein E1B28_011785 [Marasmius oreades]
MASNEPQETPTLDEINKYFPDDECEHRPPIFDYGFALTDEQVIDYAREQGLIPADGEWSSDQDPWSIISWRMLCIFNYAVGLRIPGEGVEIVLPYIDPGNMVLLKVATNYEVPFSRKKADKLLDMIKQAFKVDPTWHMSRENRERLQDNYYLDRISPSLQWGMEVLLKDEEESGIIDTP